MDKPVKVPIEKPVQSVELLAFAVVSKGLMDFLPQRTYDLFLRPFPKTGMGLNLKRNTRPEGFGWAVKWQLEFSIVGLAD